VRVEHAVTGNRSRIEYFCSRCEHSWTIAEPERRSAPRPVKRRPEPSKSPASWPADLIHYPGQPPADRV